MTMQPRRLSLIESLTSTLAGLVVSFIIQLIIYPAMGIPVRLSQNVVITIVFTGASVLRGYVIRRVFNRYKINR
jgi:hypothetical protein